MLQATKQHWLKQ